jgi:hypothetical protein
MDSSADPVQHKPITRVVKFGADTHTTALPDAAATAAAAAAAAPTAAPGRMALPAVSENAAPARAAAAPATAATTTSAAPAPALTVTAPAPLFAKEPVTPRALLSPAAAGASSSSTSSTASTSSAAPTLPAAAPQPSGLARELSETGMLRAFGRPAANGNDKASISGGFSHHPDAAGGGGGGGAGAASNNKAPTTPSHAAGAGAGGAGAAGAAAAAAGAGGAGGGGGGKEIKLKVFITLQSDSGALPALKVMVPEAAKVSEVIGHILREYTRAARTPPLPHATNSDAWELRMVDDEDGTPDDDMPPLERSQPLSKFQLDGVVALLPKPGFVAAAGAGAGGAAASAAATAAGASGALPPTSPTHADSKSGDGRRLSVGGAAPGAAPGAAKMLIKVGVALCHC